MLSDKDYIYKGVCKDLSTHVALLSKKPVLFRTFSLILGRVRVRVPFIHQETCSALILFTPI